MILEVKVMPLIYLASPFRHADPNVQRRRILIVNHVAAQLFLQGHCVFSPLTHNTPLIDLIDDQVAPEHWLQFDLRILRCCDQLLVLKLEGWDVSRGVQREIAFAREHNIPIEEMNPPKEELISKCAY